jgi:hypothetical protein
VAAFNRDRGDDVRLLIGRHAGRAAEVEDGVPFRAQLHALEAAGQEAAAPLPRRDRLRRPSLAGLVEHDEAGQVLRLASQAVRDPSAHARPAGDLRAGVHEHVGRIVVDRLGGHRAHQADVVEAACVWQQIATPFSC